MPRGEMVRDGKLVSVADEAGVWRCSFEDRKPNEKLGGFVLRCERELRERCNKHICGGLVDIVAHADSYGSTIGIQCDMSGCPLGTPEYAVKDEAPYIWEDPDDYDDIGPW